MRRTGIRLALLVGTVVGALIVGAPAAHAAPTLEVSESSGLSVGQTVTVTLDGLPPNLPTVAVGQCKPEIIVPTDCDLAGSRMGKADEQGVWEPNDGTRTITLVASIGGVDCASAPGACTVAVTSLTDPSNILASVPLEFGAKETATPTAEAGDSEDGDSSTGVLIGVGAAVVIVVLAGVALVLRRRSSQ
ncbi:hypothetical protein HLB23_00975 [Nocardia uniformis]|uniref:Uncharacterized protein n=1 Tax=Nocardia uniformis TaxID=53432 RepID=A0A849C0E6_9NOCA|nr:neocarzinostatin apoprotein domain-containing protein [Nocardia uniformis]NNH68469.1 hypothetical protein [Nocardia uniformis]